MGFNSAPGDGSERAIPLKQETVGEKPKVQQEGAVANKMDSKEYREMLVIYNKIQDLRSQEGDLRYQANEIRAKSIKSPSDEIMITTLERTEAVLGGQRSELEKKLDMRVLES